MSQKKGPALEFASRSIRKASSQLKKPQQGTLPIEAIEREFDRIQNLFPRIDSKMNAIFAIASGEMALASLGVSGDNWRHWGILLPAGLFLVAIAATLYNLYRCTFPNIRKSGKSLVYFVEIARLDESGALRAFNETTVEEFRRDLIVQTWRTSVIASQKFLHLKHATISAMLSLVPWAWLLVASSWSST